MNFFQELFGKKKTESKKRGPTRPTTLATLPPIKTQPAKPIATDPAGDKNMIRVFDGYGREMFVPREKWRTEVLPGTIKSNWNHPDQLYGIIVNALNDGFRPDVIAAAEQLYKIDTDAARGACIWGIVLKDEGRLDQAEKVFRDFIAKHGEDGTVLTNLAKVYARRNDHAKAAEILWHALEVDPNQDNALAWYMAMHRERDGEMAVPEALRRVAALPGSWRAQLWLARTALQARQLEPALAHYQESLSRMGKPAPTDLLMQMSGDLGNAAHLPELLNLTEPHFVPEIHGLQVGNNLIKAHLDLSQLESARRIVDQLYALKRLDWQKALSFWDTEIARARVASANLDQPEPLKMSLLNVEGPIWLKSGSPATELFPAKTPNGLVVGFLCGTAEKATNSKRTEHQLADAVGRMTRALPLFLAEQVDFQSLARVQTLMPWIAGEVAGFMLGGTPWSDENAAHQARQGPSKNDYVVTTHLKTQAEPWTVELRLVRTIDGKCTGHLNAAFPSNQPEAAIPELARQLLALLAEHAEVETQPPAALYEIPAGVNFPYYLLRLEQLLAVRCGSLEGVDPNFLSGEREIIDGNIQQCLYNPHNVPARLLLAQTLLAMKKVRPDILPEFKDKLTLLQKEKPLSGPAHGVVQRMLDEALADK